MWFKSNQEFTIITADVTSLYTIIPHKDGIKYVETLLSEIGHPYRFILVDFLHIIMHNNFFKFNNQYYHQLKGTAMGTACAPAYANMLERDIVEKFKKIMWMYVRFLDDLCGSL